MDTLPPHGQFDKTTFIYALADPETEQVRYVGKANNPYIRYNQHLRDVNDTYKTRWIRSLKNRGLQPKLIILEEVQFDLWQDRERYWIKFYRDQGMHLVNTAAGGEGLLELPPEIIAKRIATYRRNGYRPTPLHRAKLSAANKGKKPSPETVEKIRAANRNRKWTSTQRAKMLGVNRGRKHTPEVRARMSAIQKRLAQLKTPEQLKAFKERTQTPESIEKRAVYHRGKIIPADVRQQMSRSHKKRLEDPERRATFIERMDKANRGRKKTPEEIEKTRQANIGRKQSDEARAKMKEAWARRKENWTETDSEKQARGGRAALAKRGPEYVEYMRQLNTGRKHAPEHIEKIRQGNIGKKMSEEARAKMREAWVRRKARQSQQGESAS